MDVLIPAGDAAAFWSGLNLLVLLVLSVLVTRQRRRHRVTVGDDGVPELVRASRAFGNASEYIPAGVAALAILALSGAHQSVVHVVGALLFFGRVAHGIGLSLTAGTSMGRSVGMILTWMAWLIASVCLLFYAAG